MGLAASQGRYLCLTARMSDLVYEGQQISQQRLALASQQQDIANKYNDAMNNKTMQAKIIGADGNVQSQQLTYDVITNKDPFSGLGMRIVDLDGNVVVPKKESMEVTSIDADGNEVKETFTNAASFITKYMTDLSPEQANEMGRWNLAKIIEYFQENYKESGITIKLTNSVDTSLKKEGEHYLFDENCTDPKYLQDMLSSGQWLLQQSSPNESEEDGIEWEEITWQGSSQIVEMYDTSDDAAAESEYEAAMADIQKKDKILELRLEQVETEEKAVEKELDSVKNIIKENIESSYKTFTS